MAEVSDVEGILGIVGSMGGEEGVQEGAGGDEGGESAVRSMESIVRLGGESVVEHRCPGSSLILSTAVSGVSLVSQTAGLTRRPELDDISSP